MVVWCTMLRREERWDQREEVNWELQSEVTVRGTPKQEIQEEQKAWAQADEEEEEREETASTQPVVPSIMVKMWV